MGKPRGADFYVTALLVQDPYELANLKEGLLTLRALGCDTGDWLGQLLNRMPVVEQAPNVLKDDQVARMGESSIAMLRLCKERARLILSVTREEWRAPEERLRQIESEAEHFLFTATQGAEGTEPAPSGSTAVEDALKFMESSKPSKPSTWVEDAENLARRFHEAYELLAPHFGYETRPETAVPWDEVEDTNRRLMIATAALVLLSLPIPPTGRSV